MATQKGKAILIGQHQWEYGVVEQVQGQWGLIRCYRPIFKSQPIEFKEADLVEFHVSSACRAVRGETEPQLIPIVHPHMPKLGLEVVFMSGCRVGQSCAQAFCWTSAKNFKQVQEEMDEALRPQKPLPPPVVVVAPTPAPVVEIAPPPAPVYTPAPALVSEAIPVVPHTHGQVRRPRRSPFGGKIIKFEMPAAPASDPVSELGAAVEEARRQQQA